MTAAFSDHASTHPVGKDSPCIALCTTALGDMVCRGCARTFDEVGQWPGFTSVQKQHVWRRLPHRHRLLAVAQCAGVLLDVETDVQGKEWGVMGLTDGLVRFALRERGWLEVLGAEGVQRQALTEKDGPAEVLSLLQLR